LSVIRGIEDKELKLLINLAGNSGEGQSGEKLQKQFLINLTVIF